MATMVKEKRREKKKSKEKPAQKSVFTVIEETCSISTHTLSEHSYSSEATNIVSRDTRAKSPVQNVSYDLPTVDDIQTELLIECQDFSVIQYNQNQESTIDSNETKQDLNVPTSLALNLSTGSSSTKQNSAECSSMLGNKYVENITDNYAFLSTSLERMVLPDAIKIISEDREVELSDTYAYIQPSAQIMPASEDIKELLSVDMLPSAPMCEVEPSPKEHQVRNQLNVKRTKLQCMPLEEAMRIYGGVEMTAVKVMSEREEAIVGAGPVCDPAHPLVDLLSTFKSSLRAVENERSKLACGLENEEKYRSTLWKIEKRNYCTSKECNCGTTVYLKATYEHAELLKDRMPIARLRLEGLLRDVQDSYCHFQHAALLAHCQIEEVISETLQSNKKEIRDALSLILDMLRVSDGLDSVLSAALCRWAAALVTALVDERDPCQLLFVLHHLFRQSQSVRWAARGIQMRVPDSVTAALALALLETLLASPQLDTAVECIEKDADESWEEVNARGAGGAVSEGALREIDLIALLLVFPLRELVARILMFTHSNIRDALPYEWGDVSGGRGLIKASCGVRVLLNTLQRAVHSHPQYVRLHTQLRIIAASALEGLSCLYQSPRAPYDKELEVEIAAELQACFTAAFSLFGRHDLHKLTTSLLTEDAAKAYSFAYILGLHDKSPKTIESLAIEVPALPCDMRTRIVTHAAIHRGQDHELARIVLDFLFQTGAKMKSTSCKVGCVSAARECLSLLIAAHPYLHTVALHIVADLAQVESLDASVINVLEVDKWRPQSGEMRAVLEHWEQRCPQMLQQLLLLLDYTPFTGVSLPVQLYLGGWLCARARLHPPAAELCWRVLLRLRTHPVCWGITDDAPAPQSEPTDAISNAYALLATSWGHCIPLICSSGVSALCSLLARPREAVHCLAPIMLVMAKSPESISLTPKFTEFFTAILNCEPTLVQRALGRGGLSGAQLLTRLALAQLEGPQYAGCGREAVLSTWLHALWRAALPAGGAALLDTAALPLQPSRCHTLDQHAHHILQMPNSKDYVTNAVQNAAVAPLLCECLLRAYYTQREANTQMFGAVANILWEQRVNGQKIHVDNALQKLKANLSSEELTIYLSGRAAMVAPLHHPSHLTLWRLFLHLYMQRPPNNMRETAVPVGPLFFSGLIKSRMLTQIIKRLQETAAYHHNQADTYKINNSTESSQQTKNSVVKSESITKEKDFLPPLSIKDLTGESSGSDSDSDLSDESEEDSKVEESQTEDDKNEIEKKRIVNMACYHTAAERMIRDFCQWLEEGDRVRASPHHADIARFIPEQALEAAWKDALSRSRPPPSPEGDEFPCPGQPLASPPEQPKTPLDLAVKSIMKIKDRSRIRSRRLIRSPLEDMNFKDTRLVLAVVEELLKDIDKLAKDWCTDISRIQALDNRLLELVSALRVSHRFPPITKHCTNTEKKCKPLVFHVDVHEWRISLGVESGIKENRSASRSAIRRLARVRPNAARVATGLQSIARGVRDSVCAMQVLHRAWDAARTDASAACGPARAALLALLGHIAQSWICQDGRLVADLLSRWCSQNTNPLQQTICGLLISPRRIKMSDWPLVYTALLRAKLPSHTVFSYLSKFEMGHWSQSAEPSQRRQLLDVLLAASVRFGAASDTSEVSILLELIGVHTTALINEHELCATVIKFTRASIEGTLPPQQWTHLIKAAELVGPKVNFDQLGYLLRELGGLWWEARSRNIATALVPHAPYVATLLCTLLRTFVAAAVKLSYQPERVGRCAWSGAQESWGPWLAPHPDAPPLLPPLAPAPTPASSAAPTDGHYTAMLKSFVYCLLNIMEGCPGCEIPILQQVFEWATLSHMSVQSATVGKESRVQASELLLQLATLPWDRHQWFYGPSLQLATQIYGSGDGELTSWSLATWRGTTLLTLLRDATHDTLDARLLTLLYLFTGTHLPLSQQILEEATRLPWWRLPESTLADCLDRFFVVHLNTLQPYHKVPQFQVLLFASELRIHPTEGRLGPYSRNKRSRAVTHWVISSTVPALHAHIHAHTESLLHTLAELAPYLEGGTGELEELLGRASVVMCMEPAAATALLVWQEWVSNATPAVTAACVSAASALTALQYCAALADTAVRAYLRHDECGWSELAGRWRVTSPWHEPAVFVSRAALHAAYVCALAHTHAAVAAPVFSALRTASIHFIENEAIVAVWICYTCRAAFAARAGGGGAREAGEESGGSVESAEREESEESARALLSGWAQPPRRSLLRVVTLQQDTDRTTHVQRLLCRLAECILFPSPDTIQAYEAACSAVQGSSSDVMSWGRNARPVLLPRLAIRLYPKYERYFHKELEAMEGT